MDFKKYFNTDINKQDLQKFDVWRGLLSFLVVVGHGAQVFIAPIIGVENYLISSLSLFAHLAVLGFFFISGIVITMSLINNYTSHNKTIDIRHFIISRFSRIFPPLLFSIFLSVIFKVIIFKAHLLGGYNSYKLPNDLYSVRENYNFSIQDVLYTLRMKGAYLANVNGPLWSLIIEWWLYFFGLFTFLVILSKKYGIKFIWLICLYFVVDKITEVEGVIYLVFWLMGALFYILSKYKLQMTRYSFFIALLLCVFLEFYFHAFSKRLDFSQNRLGQFAILFLFIGLIYKLPFIKIFQNISKYSYSLYIIHFPLFLFMYSLFHKLTYNSIILSSVLLIFSFFLVFIVSKFSALYFENKNYIQNKIEKYF